MGDGGVACIPLQQQQHVIERLPNAAAEKALSGNGFGSGLLKAAGKRKKKKVKVKKKVAPAAKKVVNSELAVTRSWSYLGLVNVFLIPLMKKQ